VNIVNFLRTADMNELIRLKDSQIATANKSDMVSMVDAYLQELSLTGGEPLQDLALCRKFVFLLEEIEKGLKDYVIKELSTYERQENEVLGATLKVVESAPRFDFSASQSWVEQKSRLDEESKKLKDIEGFIKSLKSKTTVVDDQTGEAFEFFPPAKTSSTTIRVTLK
jgi:hypothetical protein